MQPEVTVLITSYNPGSYLKDALLSVFKQSYKRWKVILVDDGSTDNSLLEVSQYLRDSRVKLLQNRVNLGQSKSLNVGLAAVETPYMLQLDADDWLLPYTLEVLVREAVRQPEEVAVISGNIMVVFENSGSDGKEVSFVRKGRFFKNKYDFLLADSSLWPRFYRVKALRDVGGWPTDDPCQGRYLEDKRILFRLIEKYRFHWIDQVLYAHRRHRYNQTLNIKDYAYMTEWNVRDALRRWGDEFEPVFSTSKWGWKTVRGLIPKKK